MSDATGDELVTFFLVTSILNLIFFFYFNLILIHFKMISTAFMWLIAYRLHFHPVNDLFLITGGLHLLRGISLYCCCFTHDRWDCNGHRALLPICEDRSLKFFNLCSLLAFLCARSSSSVRYICSTEFTLRGLSFVNQQVPWLHMLYAAIGAIVYTLVSLLTWDKRSA